ncbi:amidase signature domain-containing protein [Triangularia verruculosa]|uniref:Amidase signature domain-containing protein n=1 Tax=Triangularia verruculosa TaxID=2587418 RepID=A0AAN7ASC1_9PEZI|nr:amidase signature domain-containing protein [Triangularia verruculosa]
MAQHRRFFNYPEPLEGPDVPYENERGNNPALSGIVLVIAANLMEWFRFLREMIWNNTGFGSLRKIIPYIEDYEPWFEPQIVPIQDEVDKEPLPEEPLEEDTKPDTAVFYPEAKYYSVEDYRKLYLSGTLTPLDVAEALLPLIRRDIQNASEHSIAFFEVQTERVLASARESTLRYKEGRSLGLLDGVPTAVKDEYDMEGYSTTLGSPNVYASASENKINSWCVQQIEAAGALLLGKLSMHEFGLDTTGNNPHYGTPKNPHNPNYYTGGSSSGTAYAVAAGLIPIGLGSDGGGSIRIPSSLCGVFGLKPTHGRLSFRPGPNHCVTCACLGPIASDMTSLATLFSVVSNPHTSSPFPPLPSPLKIRLPSPDDVKVLGIPQAWISQATPAIQTLVNTMIRTLVSKHGYTTVPITIPFLVEGQIAHAMTVLTDAATLLPEYKNLTYANRILLALGRTTPATDYMLAQKLRRLLMQHLAWLWKENPGMVIITPTTACEGWEIRGGKGELRYGLNDGDRTMQSMEFVWLGNFCGLPSLSCPAGFVKGKGGEVPVGVMATGEWCSEVELMRLGRVVEGIVRGEGEGRMRRPAGWVDVVERARGLRVSRGE